MNDKIFIREPLFVAPNECKSGAAQHEQDNFFSRERKEGASLINHIGKNGSYRKCEKWEQDGRNEQKNNEHLLPLQLNEREDMSCFVKYKENLHNLTHEKNIFNSCRKGEINNKYNIMDNMHDIHYTSESTKNLNDFLKHVKINHTAPCVGEFRTCMNCFVSISTLFCKTCNIFLCAVCSIKLHKNNLDHIINVVGSGLFQNDYSYNDVIVKEKDKWLVEMDNNIPVKIREKCPVHTNEYVKYACRTCQYILLCTDCLLNDPVHVQNQLDDGRNPSREKREDESNWGDKVGENKDSGIATLPFGASSLGGGKNGREMVDLAIYVNPLRRGNQPSQTIVSIDKKVETTTQMSTQDCDLVNLKPGFKLIRGSHEIYTLVDAKNEIKQELNDKLEALCKKSLILKNTIPSLRNIYKYGKITRKNVKRSIRASFTITNVFLEKKKKKLHQELKMVQDRSTEFLKKMDEQRMNYHNYLERKKNELQHMVKLSGRNAGLSLDYYVEKLESYKCLFFSKDNLIDIEKKLEIPHSKMKSEHLPFLVESMKVDVLEAKKNVTNTSAQIRREFEKLFNCTSEISVYPEHFKNILQKRIYDKHRVEPVDGDAKRRQRYFHVLPFTDLYMNMEVTYQQQFWRKDSLHQKWEARTVSLRSIYLCVHTHSCAVGRSSLEKGVDAFTDGNHHSRLPIHVPLPEDSPKNVSGEDNQIISKNEINNFSNDIESIVSITNVSVKLFSDPDITNITILEKRNHPYGIEITEYNEKRDLCGYWLLTAKKESDVNNLFNTLMSLKKEKKISALIPSFHPKINMNNSMFNFHHKNVNSVYKHMAANLTEQPVVFSVGEESKENRLEVEKDSLETVQNRDTDNYNYDGFMRDSSLLYYYDGMDDPAYRENVKRYKIEELIPGQINLSDSNDQMALVDCKKNMCAESNSTESMNPFSLDTSALREDQLGEGLKIVHSSEGNITSVEQPQRKQQRDIPRGEASAQKGVKTGRVHTMVGGVHPKWKNTNPPDVNINSVKPNLVHEEQHFMALNVGSNFSHGDYTAGMYSNGVDVMKGGSVGTYTGCYSEGDAHGGSILGRNVLGGVIPVGSLLVEERTNVGEQTNEHLVERRNGDHGSSIFNVSTMENYRDKSGLKNGLILRSLHVENHLEIEGDVDACNGIRKVEPHKDEIDRMDKSVLNSTGTSLSNRKQYTDLGVIQGGHSMHFLHHKDEEMKGGDTKMSNLKEKFAKMGELLKNEGLTKFLGRLDSAKNMNGSSHKVGAESATRTDMYCKAKCLTDGRLTLTKVGTKVEKTLFGHNEGEAEKTQRNDTPGRVNRQDHKTGNEDPKSQPNGERNGEPNGERFSMVYSDGEYLIGGTPMNGIVHSPANYGNSKRELISGVRRENVAGVNQPCGANKGESITTYGDQKGGGLIMDEDLSSVRTTPEMMDLLRKMDKSEKECLPVGEMNAKVPFQCSGFSMEDFQKKSKIHNVLSDQRGGSNKEDLNEVEWATSGEVISSRDANGEVSPKRVDTGEQIQKGAHSQVHDKNCGKPSLMEELPREEANITEGTSTRMDNHAATSNINVILKPTSVHVKGGARIIHGTETEKGRMRSGTGRLRLKKEERHKTPPPKRKKNKDSVCTSMVSTSEPMARLKTLQEELAPGGDIPESVINRVMSQIGSKRLGS
ncbi:conserved Plasmodium protein, unknown function [Plasmodium knowlesi strain H]|uniref:B box-type domain-containing protein n=3 Tax=Plasmodium knowlesi TaxID=5850 RepID=A0A5K1UFC9_PLAKH|nr:zinc finger protein, putative [Plasmodium knowlesi strain H]OTN65793.1 Uncharacterized protein PKNOH_S100063300 [Plasmodium knowlesi]CAA9987985.1 zinc finger protein, putative [Plasmodium knowlesi strain H]SBO22094.1 conserved Plasmodium protein, unknown function [Plasmodium knowlesi strain H]SBO29158.1 conserved Plasmodium protein, unknown function [Plasmodium knowlesi strain H]VVS77459.1 zinc finger protein, putative [Plasmodium knowlesi strain H]|eukprot:XP_002258964.1 hypothetical protein, conserved in Plasmodium species [Plasmodium knowlesi strain H]